MSKTVIRLWFMGETENARHYSKVPSIGGRDLGPDDYIWVPKSIIEHTTKRGNEHEVTLPDWFIEKVGL